MDGGVAALVVPRARARAETRDPRDADARVRRGFQTVAGGGGDGDGRRAVPRGRPRGLRRLGRVDRRGVGARVRRAARKESAAPLAKCGAIKALMDCYASVEARDVPALRERAKAALKHLVKNCGSLRLLDPLVAPETPGVILRHVLAEFADKLRGDVELRRAFVTSGGLMRLQAVLKANDARAAKAAKARGAYARRQRRDGRPGERRRTRAHPGRAGGAGREKNKRQLSRGRRQLLPVLLTRPGETAHRRGGRRAVGEARSGSVLQNVG